jgi:predicted RNA-binding Zn-ribbon protein involved in translation (DUF1610 family)
MQLEDYVHVLLFACPKCGAPIVSTHLSAESNLETAATVTQALACDCGWRGESLGASASKHWVEPWGQGELSHLENARSS